MAPAPDHYIEDLTPGQQATMTKVVAEADIVAFAQVSGDTNPLHLDAEYAAATPFGERIAHGMLAASYISAVLGTQLPGHGAIYMGQTLQFRAPVKIGAEVVTTVTVATVDVARRRAVLETVCTVDDTVVVKGEATIMLPNRP